MRLSHDDEGDTLSIILRREQIPDAGEYDPVILNFRREDDLVEIEIQRANRVMGDFLEAMIRAKPGKKLIAVPVP